jgi:hypothetical protein
LNEFFKLQRFLLGVSMLLSPLPVPAPSIPVSSATL